MRPLAALALAAVTTTALVSCSGGGGGEGGSSPSESASASVSASEAAAPEVDPVTALQDGVDTTLALTSFSLDGDLGVQGLADAAATVSGAVDYDTSVADLQVDASTAGAAVTAVLLSDGTDLWVGLEGDQVPTLPGGRRYLEGSADQLVDSPTFSAGGLLAPVLVLRGVSSEDQVESLGSEDVDGVPSERYRATVTYDEAVAGASEDERALLEETLALGGDPSGLDLEVEAAVGEDSVVRDLQVQVLDDAGAPQGSYAVSLSGVGEDVPAPAAPDPSEVASGALVERLLDQLDQIVTP